MKPKPFFITAICAACMLNAKAQNTFPASGNVGIGTLTPAATLQVIGTSRMGSAINYAQVDGNGQLKFFGTGGYSLAGNKYAFRLNNTNYGMFFNSTLTRYELLDGVARPVFFVNGDNGNGFFSGGLQINNTTETLQGNMRWTGTDFEGYDGSAWKSLTGKSSWSLKGNAGIDSASNFIGTTDAKPLIFKVNNVRAGFISSVSNNSSIGYEALQNNTGILNSAFGYGALKNNGIGNANTAIGAETLNANTEGVFNTATGYRTLYENTTGDLNTANGGYALYHNTTGSFNVANGYDALHWNTTGTENTATGNDALLYNTTGNDNTATGSGAMSLNTTGSSNSATGYRALASNSIGGGNTASGHYSLYENTTGNYNAGYGVSSLLYNTSGYNNTAAGTGSLIANTTGYGNTGLGYNTGSLNGNNTYCTFIGNDADQSVITDFTNSTALGNSSRISASNQVRIGNSSVTSIGGFKAWSNLSDGRYKKNIKENVPGLAFINALKPVTYNLDIKGVNAHFKKRVSATKDAKGNIIAQPKEDEKAIADVEATLETGFIAQDVEAAAKKIGYQFSGVDAPKNSEDFYGLRYSEFVVPLVKAVQELSKINEEKDNRIDNLQKQIDDLKAMITTGQVSAGAVNTANISSAAGTAKLEQNIPNPAGNSTVIKYYIPANTGNALLNIFNAAGAIIKSIPLTASGSGQLNIQTNQLAAGAYSYTLTVNGKIADSKKMVIIK